MVNKKYMGMITPSSRVDFERNMYHVFEDVLGKMDSDRLGSLAAFTWPHLKRVKPLPNGRINLLTIDESIRLQANMLYNMEFMDFPNKLDD